MTMLIVYGLLALVVPYAIFRWYHNNTTVVYNGTATVCTAGLLPRERRTVTPYDFLSAILPSGKTMVVEVSKERLAKLKGLAVNAMVTVSRPLFGAEYISRLTFAGEEATAVAGDTKYDGLYLAVAYLLLGLFSIAFLAEPQNQAMLGRYGNIYSALLFVVSGAIMGARFVPKIPADGEARFLYVIRLGKGTHGLWVMTILASIITAACFWFGGLALLVGFSSAFSVGMLLSMLRNN